MAGGRFEALEGLVEGGTRLDGGLHEVVAVGLGRLARGVVGAGLRVVGAGSINLKSYIFIFINAFNGRFSC